MINYLCELFQHLREVCAMIDSHAVNGVLSQGTRIRKSSDWVHKPPDKEKNVIVQVCEDSLMIASNTLALDHL
jgi:hypothetical protein